MVVSGTVSVLPTAVGGQHASSLEKHTGEQTICVHASFATVIIFEDDDAAVSKVAVMLGIMLQDQQTSALALHLSLAFCMP